MPGLLFTQRVCFATLLLFTAAVAAVADDKPQLPDGPAKATVQKICGGCHAPEIVVGRHQTKAEWEQIVSSMVDKGANGTDDEFNAIIDYLAANFPKKTDAANSSGATR